MSVFTPTAEQHFNETYELHHLLGQGGFAVVYSGTRVRDGLPVSAVFFVYRYHFGTGKSMSIGYR